MYYIQNENQTQSCRGVYQRLTKLMEKNARSGKLAGGLNLNRPFYVCTFETIHALQGSTHQMSYYSIVHLLKMNKLEKINKFLQRNKKIIIRHCLLIVRARARTFKFVNCGRSHIHCGILCIFIYYLYRSRESETNFNLAAPCRTSAFIQQTTSGLRCAQIDYIKLKSVYLKLYSSAILFFSFRFYLFHSFILFALKKYNARG